jgi:5-methylcytosine-specific restriction endonuclease McrA
MFTEKAEVVELYPDREVHSAKETFKVPAILKIKYVAKARPRINFSRWAVFSRDNFSCCYCGEKYPSKGLSLDHVVPLSHGGHKNWANIVTACFECNQRKGNRTPQQAGLKMYHHPHEPKWNPSLFLQMQRTSMEDIWKPWLNLP